MSSFNTCLTIIYNSPITHHLWSVQRVSRLEPQTRVPSASTVVVHQDVLQHRQSPVAQPVIRQPVHRHQDRCWPPDQLSNGMTSGTRQGARPPSPRPPGCPPVQASACRPASHPPSCPLVPGEVPALRPEVQRDEQRHQAGFPTARSSSARMSSSTGSRLSSASHPPGCLPVQAATCRPESHPPSCSSG